MFKKQIDNRSNINPLIAARWSGRAYDPARLVNETQIFSLLEAARWAPSCYGDQPWRFILFDKTNDRAAWNKAQQCLADANRSWACNAPLLFLVVANTVMSRTGNTNQWGEYDTGAAAENLCLQAVSMGLMAHQMGGFDMDKTRALFHVPAAFIPKAMIAVGYQMAEKDIPPELKEREYSARERKPLADHFFYGCWGNTDQSNQC